MRPLYELHDYDSLVDEDTDTPEGAVTPDHRDILDADPEFDRGDIWDDAWPLESDYERAARDNDANLEAEDAVAAALSLGGPNACEWATPSALSRLRSALGPTPETSVREVGPRGWVQR